MSDFFVYWLGVPFALTITIILLIDGIKLLMELLSGTELKDYTGDPSQVTVVIPAFNEADTITETIKSILKIVPAENIIIANDGSTDKTADVVEKEYGKIGVRLISAPNQGKTRAMQNALKSVKTKFVLIMDADTKFSDNFVIPTEALEKRTADAVTFNVVPIVQNEGFFNKLWLNFQKHEYTKSMIVGKKSSTPTKSVHCVSGAAGLFWTSQLEKIFQEHTGIFTGEDLENTLRCILNGGEIIFSRQIVYTDVPQSFVQLLKQRVVGWWPGLWRNMWLMLKIIFKKNKTLRLRFEMIYEILALLTAPFKMVSLFFLTIHKEWETMLFVYMLYLLFEVFIYIKIKASEGDYMKMEWLVVVLFPVYGLLQIFLLILGFFQFLYKKFLTNDWSAKKVATATATIVLAVVLFLPLASKAQDKEKWTMDLKQSHITDKGKNRTFENQELYLGYKNIYFGITNEPYNTMNFGFYYGPFITDFRYKWETGDTSTKLQYEKWFGNFVPHVSASYGSGGDYAVSLATGANYYFGDYGSNFSFDINKELGRVYGLTYVTKIKLVRKSFWSLAGFSLTNFGDKGIFGQVGYKWFYLNADYYQNYDFNDFDRTSIGAGVMLKF